MRGLYSFVFEPEYTNIFSNLNFIKLRQRVDITQHDLTAELMFTKILYRKLKQED